MDDISFVYYDSKTNTKMPYQIPNISVIIDEKEIPLEKVTEEFIIDQQAGKKN